MTKFISCLPVKVNFKLGFAFIVALTSVLMMYTQVVYAESIQVTYPNSYNDYWAPGAVQEIKWNSTGLANKSVKIELLKNGAVNQVINANYPIGSSNPSTISWQVPQTQLEGNDYRIRVTTVNYNPEITDLSDYNFHIMKRTVTVTKPNGGEKWVLGATQQITWTSSGFPPSGSYAFLYLHKPPNQRWLIASYLNLSSGSYSWTVGKLLTDSGWTSSVKPSPGSDYTVEISASGPGGANLPCYDLSNQSFSLTPMVMRQVIPQTIQKR